MQGASISPTRRSRQSRVAVLGGGIMGCCTALMLAREGVSVTLFEREKILLGGASRWNEGKIHLGFLYCADPALHTAKELLQGGLQFKPIMEDLLGTALQHVTLEPDLYLVHRKSVASVDDTRRYFSALQEMVAAHPMASLYPGGEAPSGVAELPRHELDALVDTSRFQAGFATPERSVCTQHIADQLVDAVRAEPLIECCFETEVLGAGDARGSEREALFIVTENGEAGPFTHVVNALWAGRPTVDSTLQLDTLHNPSIRYRLSLFVETSRPLNTPSAVICTGPFGDVKNYDGRRFYLSWYPAGLVYSSNNMTVPVLPPQSTTQQQTIIADTFSNLIAHLPKVEEIRDNAARITLAGGWVFANGRGSLSNPRASVHRRDHVGIHQSGQWFSVDTGKYSIAPWLAKELTQRIIQG